MIKGISASGRYVTVTNGSPNNPYISPGAVGAGMLRWNPNMNSMEINDGNNWRQLDMNYSNIGLTSEAESLLDWAKEQRIRQQQYEVMAKDHPAIKNALDVFKRAEQQLDLVYKLSKEHENDFGEVQASP